MAKTRRGSGAFAAAEATLRAHAMAKPEATEHFPWGERAIKVKGKVFLFMYRDASKLSLSTKLPSSNGVALMLPFAQPTGYGLGKAGWVSASFERTDKPPVDMLCAWIDESYQAVAPAKLAAAARAAAPPVSPAASRRTTAKR
jgi:predicted DNA-binding protein (MmcQ/YjbR family)